MATETPVPKRPEINLYRGRIWLAGGPFEGVPYAFKAPYGVGVTAATVLARAVATEQITRFDFGRISMTQFRKLARQDPNWRKKLLRYDEAFAAIGSVYSIDWSA